MLRAAAERGVQVHIIVYKEVTQALTRKYFSTDHASADKPEGSMLMVGVSSRFSCM